MPWSCCRICKATKMASPSKLAKLQLASWPMRSGWTMCSAKPEPRRKWCQRASLDSFLALGDCGCIPGLLTDALRAMTR